MLLQENMFNRWKQEDKMREDNDRGKRIAIMAIKENAPKKVEREMLNLIASGFTLKDLKSSGYSSFLSK